MKKILYIRSGPYELNFNNYNLQEVGLGKAFCRAGYDFDILYYSKENMDQIIETENNQLRILWRKGIKCLRTGLYPSIWKKEILSKYDTVIVSEYSQLMSVIVASKHSNTYVYNGPYYNLFKIPFIEKVYDHLFCGYLNEHTKRIFCKTQMAEDYIIKKGITNTLVVGVGLDTAKFDAERIIESDTKKLIKRMENHRNLLYVGQIIKRKNVELLIKSFVELEKNTRNSDLQLVLVGKGDELYTKYCESLLPEDIRNDVIWCKFIKNAQMKFIYQEAKLFLLPSTQEIFGMVLLEAMNFRLPVVSSHSAGAGTLIKNGENGIIVEEFNEEKWGAAIKLLLENQKYALNLGENAAETIKSDFMWDGIARKMIANMEG